jgi:hypothetical protein
MVLVSFPVQVKTAHFYPPWFVVFGLCCYFYEFLKRGSATDYYYWEFLWWFGILFVFLSLDNLWHLFNLAKIFYTNIQIFGRQSLQNSFIISTVILRHADFSKDVPLRDSNIRSESKKDSLPFMETEDLLLCSRNLLGLILSQLNPVHNPHHIYIPF